MKCFIDSIETIPDPADSSFTAHSTNNTNDVPLNDSSPSINGKKFCLGSY